MKIVELSKEKYNAFAFRHPLISFYQVQEWGELKAKTGWRQVLLGYVDDEENVLAAGNFLLKKMPGVKRYLAYCPRGYLIDYKNQELLKNFNDALKAKLKSLNCFELIIDPNFPCRQRDVNGDIVEGGYDNREVVNELISMGYRHNGYNLYYENLQPRWLFRLNITRPYEELEKDFKNEAKRRSRKKDFLAINTRELARDEVHVFQRLSEMTAARRGFDDRSLKYYMDMYDALHDAGVVRYMVSEIDVVKCRENVNKEVATLEERIAKSKNPGRIKEDNVTLTTYKKILEQLDKCEKESGSIVPLSATCIMSVGNEMIMLFAGNDEDYLQHFNSSNIMVTDLIKLAQEEGYEYFNFYGITGDFSKDNPQYGLYLYKRQYGGEVLELIGEFEYIFSPLVKKGYDFALNLYEKLRKLRK